MSHTPLWYCPWSRLYFREPCYAGRPLLYRNHDDVYVGDALSVSDLDDHDLGFDLAWERWELRNAVEPS